MILRFASLFGPALLCHGSIVSAAAGADDLTAAEMAAGWKVLFDGQSTDHWRGYQRDSFPESGWKVEDGALRVIAGGGGGDIISKDKYENFELVLEWKAAPNANSGIMYRVTEEYDTPWKTGPEFQILDDPGYDLEPSDIHSAGAMYDLSQPDPDKVIRPAGEWNAARIRLEDGRVRHWLNGVLVVDEDFNSPDFRQRVESSKFGRYDGFATREEGHIALQDHGNDVWFRNIRIRDLDAPMPGEIALFNGKNLDGLTGFFNGGASLADVFSVRDGMMICKGEPNGYVRTEEKFDNFVLRLQWRWNPETQLVGNSGVLVRMIGEDKVWPRSIEAQLHSGNAGDIINIGDFDMKTSPGRTIGARTMKTHFAENWPGMWNEYEIICDGGEVILRVNGQETNRAWDAAEVAGHICLQSEGTEIHFRNIRLAPIGRTTSESSGK